jgi:hypothetical protein
MCLKNRSPRHRKFIASDGQEYCWSWRTNTRENLEWSVSILGAYLALASESEHLMDRDSA